MDSPESPSCAEWMDSPEERALRGARGLMGWRSGGSTYVQGCCGRCGTVLLRHVAPRMNAAKWSFLSAYGMRGALQQRG